ncbi:MAG: hypothetical protein QOK17_2672 [Sphingomonadales bacterium]|nr:hypothetical protein [Sphingomonadales bacterium]
MSSDLFSSILTGEFRWPRQGDNPFAQSTEWQANAYIDPHGHGRLVMMMTGYKEGADLMVQRTRDDRRLRDSLVFPIIFNYRQFLELSLKYLIATYGPTVGVAVRWKRHELAPLWEAFAEVLQKYGHTYPDESDQATAKIVLEFAEVDPGSFSYRYPVDRNGNAISLSHEELDLTVLCDVMNAVDHYFTGCDGFLGDLQSAGP